MPSSWVIVNPRSCSVGCNSCSETMLRQQTALSSANSYCNASQPTSEWSSHRPQKARAWKSLHTRQTRSTLPHQLCLLSFHPYHHRKDIVIRKADKGSCIVIQDRSSYVTHTLRTLTPTSRSTPTQQLR